MAQDEVLKYLIAAGAKSRDTALPARQIMGALKNANVFYSLERLARWGDVRREKRELGRFWYWVTARQWREHAKKEYNANKTRTKCSRG